MASASVLSPILSCHPLGSNWEQKIVEPCWWRASTISRRSLDSVSFNGVIATHPRLVGLHSCIFSLPFYTFLLLLRSPIHPINQVIGCILLYRIDDTQRCQMHRLNTSSHFRKHPLI